MGGKRSEMFTHKISGAYVLFMTANPHRCHSIQTKTEEDRYDLGEDRFSLGGMMSRHITAGTVYREAGRQLYSRAVQLARAGWRQI